MKDSDLKAVWDELWLNLDDSTFHKYPLLMQHCNTKVFEQVVKSNFSLPEAACNNSSQLTDDEENGLRYAAGFVIRSVRKKIAKDHHPYKSGMLAVLALLKEQSDDSTGGDDYLSYTKTWIEKVNRGGLFLISDDTMEYATRSCFSLNSSPFPGFPIPQAPLSPSSPGSPFPGFPFPRVPLSPGSPFPGFPFPRVPQGQIQGKCPGGPDPLFEKILFICLFAIQIAPK